MGFGLKIEKSNILPGVTIFMPDQHFDTRGSVWSSFTDDEYNIFLPKGLTFKHDKFSVSDYAVLRGIHGDQKSWKLVSCVAGEIFQVCRRQ